MLKVLLTATVQSHICQFHKPLVQMLREHGDVEIHVAAKNNLAEKNGLALDFVDKVYDVPFSRSPKSLDNIRAYRELKEIIDVEKYDIIHCNTPMAGIVTRLAAIATRKRGTKVIYTAHGFHFYHGAPKINWIVYYPIEKCFAKLTDTLITINDEDYNIASRKFSCKVEKIHGVGVDSLRYRLPGVSERSELCEKLQLPEKNKYILCVGELLPNKNQKMAIEAMRKLILEIPEAVLLIAGNGPQRDSLVNMIETYGLQNNVILLGYCTNLEEYQRMCELSISCSKREGLGLNLIEAMLSGNPVIATKNRGHNELVQHNKNGFLVDINDVENLTFCIKTILNDTSIRDNMRCFAHTYAQKYNATKVSEELKKIYFES